MSKTIPQLDAVSLAALTDLIEVSQAATTTSRKETLQQVLNLFNANLATAPYAVGDLFYAATTSTVGKLADVATGNALISGGVGASPSYGKIGLATHVSGTLPVLNGGTGQTTYTDGQLLIGNTTGNTLTKATLTEGAGISITNGNGTITIASTLDSSVTLQDAYDNGTGAINVTSGLKPFTVSQSGADYSQFVIKGITKIHTTYIANDAPDNSKSWTIAALDNGNFEISARSDDLTTGTNFLQVSRTGTTVNTIDFPNGMLTYAGVRVATINDIPVLNTPVEVTGTSQSMAIHTAYIANNAALVTLTLPATAAVGSTILVIGKGAGGWRVAQNSGQTINLGSAPTTTGVSGRLDSTNRYDCLTLYCIVADTTWIGYGVQGNITVT